MDTGPYDLRLKLTGLKMPCGEEYFLSISSSTVAVFNPESKACAKRNGLRVEPGDLKAFAPLLNPWCRLEYSIEPTRLSISELALSRITTDA